MKRHLDAMISELNRTLSGLDEAAIGRILDTLMSGRRIFTAGAGRSGLMMRSFAMRLMHLGLNVSVVGETVTPAIGEHDVLLIGSGSGATASLLSHAKRAREIGAVICLITVCRSSPIGSLADMILEIPAPSPKIDAATEKDSIQPMGALFEQCLLLTLDALILEIMNRTGRDSADMFTLHANLE
ncbi:MAG: 6-phospho-3-hexuloisomerase [Candidatus Latescibacteria bacterium]|nr:6-phospho-3-hexuloisomerase [Candidatus Latescibacterota bacterium]